MHATFTPHGGSQAKIGQDGKVQDRAEVALQLRGAVRAKPGTEAAESQPSVAGKSKTQAPAEQQENANDRGLAPEGRTEESKQAESPAGSEEGQHSEEAPPGESNRVKRKWKAALDKKKAAETERDAMAQEVAALKAQLDAIQRGQHQPQAQPQKAAVMEFKEAFPEDGTMEQQAAWHGRKAAHDQMRQMFPAMFLEHAQPAFRNFAEVLKPALQFSVSEMGNREWNEMQPILDSVGAEVKEVRPVVEALLEQHPQMSIHDALGRVLFDPAYRAHWQEVGPPEAAGRPAKAPARTPARSGANRPGSMADGLSPQELIAASQEAKSTGNFHQRAAFMAAYLKGAVKKKRA